MGTGVMAPPSARAAALLPLVVDLAVTFAGGGRFEIVPIAFAVATTIGAAAAVTLTLAPDAWPVVVARCGCASERAASRRTA
jgi:hypothetical protein